MVESRTPLPEGAGALTGEASTGTAPHAGHSQQNSATSPNSRNTGSSGASEDEREFQNRAAHREIVLAEHRSPTAAAVVGAAIAGAIAGGAIPFLLAGRGSSRSNVSKGQDTPVSESIIINRPPREIYDFWRNFTNLSRFMENIKSVELISDTRSHWVIKAPVGTSVEFDSRVVDDVPGRSISWEAEPGAAVPNRGRVEFIETASGDGTNVLVTMSYDPPAGAAGRLVAKLSLREPSVQAREDLERLKRLMESSPNNR